MLENTEHVRTAWQEAINTPPPSRKAIYCIADNFETLVSVCNAPKYGRSTNFMTEENEMLVSMKFGNSPKKSTRRASQHLSISRSSLRRVMDKLNLKLYCSRLIHGLLEDDPHHRLLFCESIHAHITNKHQKLLDKIIWSDEGLVSNCPDK